MPHLISLSLILLHCDFSVADTSITFTIGRLVIAPTCSTSISVGYTPRSTALVHRILIVQTTGPRQPRVPYRFISAEKQAQ